MSANHHSSLSKCTRRHRTDHYSRVGNACSKFLIVNMIILWSQSDIDGTEEKDWLNEHLIHVEYQRDPIPSHVKTTVRAYKDAYEGVLIYKPVYSHYVRWPSSYSTFLCHPTVHTGFLGSAWLNIQGSNRIDEKAHAQRDYRFAWESNQVVRYRHSLLCQRKGSETRGTYVSHGDRPSKVDVYLSFLGIPNIPEYRKFVSLRFMNYDLNKIVWLATKHLLRTINRRPPRDKDWLTGETNFHPMFQVFGVIRSEFMQLAVVYYSY